MSMRWLVPIAAAIWRRLRSRTPARAKSSNAAARSGSRLFERPGDAPGRAVAVCSPGMPARLVGARTAGPGRPGTSARSAESGSPGVRRPRCTDRYVGAYGGVVQQVSWRRRREAFLAAAACFTEVVERAWEQPEEHERPALGEWTVRDLVGHTLRAVSTVEAYLTD